MTCREAVATMSAYNLMGELLAFAVTCFLRRRFRVLIATFFRTKLLAEIGDNFRLEALMEGRRNGG